MAGWIKMSLGVEVGLCPGHIVLDGDPAPPEKGHSPPQFSAHVYCGQTAMSTRIPLGMELGLSLGEIVLDGDPTPHPLVGHIPQFSANVYCGQMAGWTKLPLGMEVGLSPGNFVFDEDPAFPQKRGIAPRPIFGPCLLLPNGWMDQDATWYGGKPQPR